MSARQTLDVTRGAETLHPLVRHFASDLHDASLSLSGDQLTAWRERLQKAPGREDAIIGILAIAVELTKVPGMQATIEQIVNLIAPLATGTRSADVLEQVRSQIAPTAKAAPSAFDALSPPTRKR